MNSTTLSTQGKDHSQFLEVRRELDLILYDIALLCHAAYVERVPLGEIGDLIRQISDAHVGLQSAKAQHFATPEDLKRLRRTRRDKTLEMVRKVRRRSKFLDLPTDIREELRRYEKLSQRLETLIRGTSRGEQASAGDERFMGTPLAGSVVKPEVDWNADDVGEVPSKTNEDATAEDDDENEDEDGTDVSISGLESIPDIGGPLGLIQLSPPPPSFAVWVKTKLDNVDYWFSQNRVQAVRVFRVFVVGLICINLLAFHWFLVVSYDPDDVSNGETSIAELDHDSETSASLDPERVGSLREFLRLFVPILILVGSGFTAWVCWDDKPNRYLESFNLEKVKQTLIPYDPVTASIEAFWPSFWSGNAPSESAVRARDQSLDVAQVMSAGLLVLLLLFPFAQSSALAFTGPEDSVIASADQLAAEDSENLFSDGVAESETEPSSTTPRDRMRGQYFRMTGVLVLLAGLSVLIMWLRQASSIGRDGAAFFGGGPKSSSSLDTGPTLVDVKNPEGRSLFDTDEPEIDHEDPYGAMVQSVSQNMSDNIIGRSLMIGVMIARYRLVNRWRIFSVVAYFIQNTFRFVGVIVFCGMLLISMVMPLVFLSAVQNQAKNEYAAFRALADPFMGDPLGDDDRALLEGHSNDFSAQDERVTAEPVHVVAMDTKGEDVLAAQRRSRASLYYVIAIVLMVLLNGGLAAARIFHRSRNRHIVHLSVEKGGLKAKAALVGLLLMVALLSWSDDMPLGRNAIDLRNLHADDSRVVSTVREVREKSLFKQKMVTASLAPASSLHGTWFVDGNLGSDTNDGMSWDRAYQSLSFAIDAASAMGGGEVWVAQGKYGISCASRDDGANQRSAALMLRGNVRVFGGFVGNSGIFPEVRRSERNWVDRPTVLFTGVSDHPEIEDGVIVLENGAMLDGFAVCSTRARNSAGFLSVKAADPGVPCSVIGNSVLVFLDYGTFPPGRSLGGLTLIHGSQFGGGLRPTAAPNRCISAARQWVVIPDSSAIGYENPLRGE